MKLLNPKSQSGFTLLELMIASVIGVGVMVGMTSLFRQASTALFTVTQRAETQQNMRAAIELMAKDISLAGAGLPTGGLTLPNAGGNSPIKIACNQTGTCYVPNDVYPGNYMTGVIPGFANGVENNALIPSAPAAVNDSITSIYCDYNFSLTNFQFSFPAPPSASVSLAVRDATQPTNILAPGGLNVGDLLLFLVQTPGNGTGSQGTSSVLNAVAVGEITGILGANSPWTVNFAPNDALNFNQPNTTPNSLNYTVAQLGPTLSGVNNVSVCRLYAVTYFLEVPPAGGTIQTPRLMRQVNGLPAVPVADNIINLQFSYDVINPQANVLDPNQANPLLAGDNLASIQKVNMWVMGQGLISGNNRSQSMYLASSVSTRDMSFSNSLSCSPNCN